MFSTSHQQQPQEEHAPDSRGQHTKGKLRRLDRCPGDHIGTDQQQGSSQRACWQQQAVTWSGDEPVIGPIALLQPTYGAFLRDDASRKEGSLGHGPDDWVRPDRPTALVALACRGRSKAALAVERKLEGASVADFEPIGLDDPAERCSLLVDMIQADTMTSGVFEYGVDVLSDGETVAQRSREFLALTAEEIQLASETE